MTLTIELPDNLAEPLKAHAQSKGVSPAGYACLAIKHAIAADNSGTDQEKLSARPIWEVIVDNMKDMPPEEFAKLPKDGAGEHDHYLYGHPKRNQ